MRSSSRWTTAFFRAEFLLVLVLGSWFGTSGCTEADIPGEKEVFAASADAVLLWVEPDSALLPTHRVADLKAESRTAVWLVDQIDGGLFRVDASRLDYRTMGVADDPPEEIVSPVRLAYSEEFGVFVFDLATRRVDQFTPDGTPIRSFEPGFIPARMDIVEKPIGIQFAVVDTDPTDSTPRLAVIRMDLRGEQPDTVLFPGAYGPPTLWSATAQPGQLSLDADNGGLWAWSSSAPDTAFEVTPAPGARKRVLRPQDQDPLGLLVDSEREILWVVCPADGNRLRYSAYDLRESNLAGPEDSFLGERTTSGFDPVIAIDGVVIGRVPSNVAPPRLAAYDMLAPPNR